MRLDELNFDTKTWLIPGDRMKAGTNIVLIGFMGAGKSSVGRTLARLTGRPRTLCQ